MQQPEKKMYRKAIIQYWDALLVDSNNVHIYLRLLKFSSACPTLRAKLWGLSGKKVHWRRLYLIGLVLTNTIKSPFC